MRSNTSIRKQFFRATKALANAAVTVTASAVTVASSTASIASQMMRSGSKRAQTALATSADHIKKNMAQIKLPEPSTPLIIGTAVAIVAAGALTAGTLLALKKIRDNRILSFPTKSGRARIYEVPDDNGFPVRLLEVDGIVQSGTYVNDGNEDAASPVYTDLVFDYLKKYDTIFERNKNIERICVLGCGGYDYPKHLIAHHAPVVVDAVEIDPMITSLAERYFYLDRLFEEYEIDSTDRLHLIYKDALVHLLEAGPRYDAIVNDIFDGGTVPAHVASYPFYKAVKRRLNPGGVFVTNIVSPLDGPRSDFLKLQIDYMKMVFEHVEVIPCDPTDPSTEDNVVVLAY